MSSLVSTGSAPASERRMAIVGHGFEKFPTGRLLASSAERRWPGLFAECRSHLAGDLPTYVPTYTEVALLLRGPSTVTRQADGVRQRTAAIPGTIWLCPAGLREDFITISDDIPEALHIYLPSRPFSALQTDYGSWDIGVASLRYESGLRDPLLEQIGQVILSEMQSETSSGRLLIESLTCSLAARLLQSYSDISLNPPSLAPSTKGLDHRRLRRVLEFIDAHLEDDITVGRLASIACLSQFHFARVFRTATGKSPHQHLSEKRLELAKSLLSQGSPSLVDIALACTFSSQANFSRAFRRATGMTPGQYRAASRGTHERSTHGS
jgi:AraC family transcriptional regulator